MKYLVNGDTQSNESTQMTEDERLSQKKLSKAEIDYNKVHLDKVKDDMIAKRRRGKEVIASAIMSVARIASQLKEDEKKIAPGNVDKKLSVCGLRLEHMVATLYKKKPTFNIESVNTDYSSDNPAFFLGIKVIQ